MMGIVIPLMVISAQQQTIARRWCFVKITTTSSIKNAWQDAYACATLNVKQLKLKQYIFPMDTQKQQLVDRLHSANNILVTVSTNPSVDQLVSCIGLTILLNKMKKHATAVFSGAIPDTIEFLQPEETIEKNTDSLRDFIIALDKSKADKLRYKVEDTAVKIFITPYRTSIGPEDLDFSQGDFNVDAIVALGVHDQADLDTTITSHGRILHDATVMSINNSVGTELGTINWTNTSASSLGELIEDLGSTLDPKLLDAQIATALLTGIVSETDRFRNEKTTPRTMSISAELMSAGANQQLVADKLAEPEPEPEIVLPEQPDTQPLADQPDAPTDGTGTLEIGHQDDEPPAEEESVPQPDQEPTPTSSDNEPAPAEPEPAPDSPATAAEPVITPVEDSRHLITEPPSINGSMLTANTVPEEEGPSIDPLTMQLPDPSQMLSHDELPAAQPVDPASIYASPTPSPSLIETVLPPVPPSATPEPLVETTPNETLAEIEQAVEDHEAAAVDAPATVETARDEVLRALSESSDSEPLAPIAALNANPLIELHPPEVPQPDQPAPYQPAPPSYPPVAESSDPVTQSMDLPLPPVLDQPGGVPPTPPFPMNAPFSPPNSGIAPPPPVPPPMMPPYPSQPFAPPPLQ
jgi:hypothetical protein